MEQLMRIHGWQSTGADIAFIELVSGCSCSCRCENFLSRNSRPFCSLSTSSMTTTVWSCAAQHRSATVAFLRRPVPRPPRGHSQSDFAGARSRYHGSLALPNIIVIERTHSAPFHTHAQIGVHAACRCLRARHLLSGCWWWAGHMGTA